MRTLLATIAALVLLVAGAVVAVPYVVPQDWLRQQLATQIERATGRPVAVTGPVRVRALPQLSARIEGLRIPNPPAATADDLARVEELAAELALWPLLRGDVEIARFVVRGLELHLEILEDGTATWTQAQGSDARAPADASAAATSEGEAGTGDAPAALPAISLGDVRLVDAAFHFRDARDGTARSFTDVDGQIVMRALDAPLEIDVTGRLDARALTLDGRLASLAGLLAGETTAVAASLTGDGLDLSYDGSLAMTDAASASGALSLAVDDAAATLGWLAGTAVDVPVRTLRVDGELEARPDRVVLDPVELAVDDVEGSGDVAVDLAAARPAVTGALRLGVVNLAAFTDAGGAASPDAAASGEQEAGAADAGWSTAPIAMAPLPVDLDLAVEVAGIEAPPLAVGGGSLRLSGDDGDLRVELDRLAFYDGNATGQVHLQPRDDGLAVASTARLEQFATGPLLAALSGTGFLDGTGDLRFDVRATGGSVAALVGDLDGEGRLAVGRAVLRGLQGRPELEALRTLLSLGGEPGEPIRLADITASYTITDGVLANDDFTAETPALGLAGEGTVHLAERRVPGYTITPSARGRLADVERIGRLMIPLVVSGPFDALQVRPDPAALAEQSVEQVGEALEQAQEKARQGDLEGAAETIINAGIGGVLEGLSIRP